MHLLIHTAQRARRLGLKPSRNYGYIVQRVPGVSCTTTGEDIEGIGWVPHWGGPRHHTSHIEAWCRTKAIALDHLARHAECIVRGYGSCPCGSHKQTRLCCGINPS